MEGLQRAIAVRLLLRAGPDGSGANGREGLCNGSIASAVIAGQPAAPLLLTLRQPVVGLSRRCDRRSPATLP